MPEEAEMADDDTKTTDDNTEDQAGQDTKGEKPEDFEAWLEQQDDQTKELYEEHTSGLKSALDSERETRRALEKQLRDAAEAAEEGSEAREKLEEAAAAAETANAQADFYEDAHAAGVSDLRLAWIVVQQDKTLQDRYGKPDFAKLKEQHPALFADGKKPPPGNAGAGAGTETPADDMNARIRKAARR